MSRETYGEGETKAINYFITLAKEFGFHVEVDYAANVFFSLKPIKNTKYILTGSHLTQFQWEVILMVWLE